ncbi:hypothetical protein EDC04DRAFT_2616405 [Pisolithus marmoratus]|nr:hypothetical protein EDC04DRAFT_2616405 [Pisolithus marmoratus]
MNHRAAGPPPHTEVTNFTSYTLDNALGSCQAQPVHHLELGILRMLSIPVDPRRAPRRFVDQPYLSYGATGYTLVPTQIGVVPAPIHTMNINHWGFCNEMAIFHRTTSGPTSLPDWCSNRQIRHYPDTPYTASSDIINVATGLAKVVNETFQTNPCHAGPQKKPRIDESDNCAPKQCLYWDPGDLPSTALRKTADNAFRIPDWLKWRCPVD